jgi:hypothetical protein
VADESRITHMGNKLKPAFAIGQVSGHLFQSTHQLQLLEVCLQRMRPNGNRRTDQIVSWFRAPGVTIDGYCAILYVVSDIDHVIPHGV